MTLFYAFCRIIDDIADDVSQPKSSRKTQLEQWQIWLKQEFPCDHAFGNELAQMIQHRGIAVDWLVQIIEGCMVDLEPRLFQSWEELSQYNWKVAGLVGLVSTRIFGCVHEFSDRYAEVLGNALQLTNILRDVGEDLSRGARIYLPINDLMRFQYSERDLVGKVYDGRFIALMSYEAERAESLFAEADRLISQVDRRALLAARMMAEIYLCLLRKMRRDRFRVFQKRYSISKVKKLTSLLKYWSLGSFSRS